MVRGERRRMKQLHAEELSKTEVVRRMGRSRQNVYNQLAREDEEDAPRRRQASKLNRLDRRLGKERISDHRDQQALAAVTLAGTPVEKHEESLRVAHKDAGRRFAAKSSIVSTRRRASSKTRSTLTSFIRAQFSRTLGITSGNPFWLEGRTYPVRCNCVLS